MAWAEIDVGPLPPEVRSIVIDYRLVSGSSYVRLGETQARVSRWQVPQEPPILLRARFRDERGRIGGGLEERFEATSAVSDRPAMADLDVPAAVVKQADGPTIEIVQDVPHGSDPKEFAVEIAQAPLADAHPKDGVSAGHAEPGEKVTLHSWTADFQVFTRLKRVSDGRTTDWVSSGSVIDVAPTVAPTAGHTNDFASGTIGAVGGVLGAEVSGGDLRSLAKYAGDYTGTAYAGSLSLPAGEYELYIPFKYTTATVTVDPPEPLMIQTEPVRTSVTRPTQYAGDWHWPAGGPPHFEPDGDPYDRRVPLDGLTAGGGNVAPIRVIETVSIGGAAAVPLVPGKVYPAVGTYAVTFEIWPWYSRRVTWDYLRVWHWVWCRARPWHTHSSGFELLYEETLAGAAVSHDATIADGDDWAELYVSVLWTNAVAATVVLYVRPNNDSTATNYVDSGGADPNDAFTMGAGIAQNTTQRAGVRILRPASGSVREAIVDDAFAWTATTTAAPGGGDTYIWKNTADAITSFRVLTDNGGSALAAGTRIEVWGKRRHQA